MRGIVALLRLSRATYRTQDKAFLKLLKKSKKEGEEAVRQRAIERQQQAVLDMEIAERKRIKLRRIEKRMLADYELILYNRQRKEDDEEEARQRMIDSERNILIKMEMKELEENRVRAIRQLQIEGNTERLENERAANEANGESVRRQAKEREIDNRLNSKKKELDAAVAKAEEVERIEQNKERLIIERKRKAENEETLRRQARERQVRAPECVLLSRKRP